MYILLKIAWHEDVKGKKVCLERDASNNNGNSKLQAVHKLKIKVNYDNPKCIKFTLIITVKIEWKRRVRGSTGAKYKLWMSSI